MSEQTVVSRAKHLQAEYPKNNDRDTARQKLLAAGFLVTSFPMPDNVTILSPDELLEAGRLPGWARSTSELIDEDSATIESLFCRHKYPCNFSQ